VADNGTITFVRNRYWSKATDPVRTALPDKVVLQTDIVPAERDRRVLAGAADADVSGSGLQQDAATKVLADPALTARTDDPSTGTVRFVAMPSAVGALGDVHCRRAVQYALDKAAVKDALGGPYAASLATTCGRGCCPATRPPRPTRWASATGATSPRPARAGLCGKPGGFTTTLGTVNDGRGKVAADVVIRSLAGSASSRRRSSTRGARSWPRSPAHRRPSGPTGSA
jgi:peptide/nickel transport system substrate-binding protein